MRRLSTLLPLLFCSTALSAAAAFDSREVRPAPTPGAELRAWPWPHGGAALSATASADPAKPGARLTRYHFGNNTSWWSRWEWNLDEDRLAKARQGGMAFWRFPGGSSSDWYFWDHSYGKYAKGYNGEDAGRMALPEYLHFDHFMEFCAKTGSEPILTLNYGLARYGSLQEALDLATRWIVYAKQKGYKIRYVEVGNENYGPWEGGTDGVPGKERLTGEDYGRDVVAFAKALKKVDPKIQVGAVVVPEDGGEDWVGFRWWNKGVMSQAKAAADFWVVHEYFYWPYSHPEKNYIDPSYGRLLSHVTRVAKIRENLDSMQDRYAGRRLPVAFDEFNLVNASPRQTIEAVNMLFTAGVLGESARLGFATTNIWDWKNGLDDNLKGDMGMLATNDPRVPEATPRPSYYAFALWKLGGGERLLHSRVDGAGLRAYASRFSGGQHGWVLINESEKALDATLSVAGRKGKAQARAWVARGLGHQDLRIRFNETEGPAGGGGPFPLEGLPAYGLEAQDGGLKLQLPGSSVTAVVLD